MTAKALTILPTMERMETGVPAVLWRLFGRRARSLLDTILALIPPPPDACPCKGQRCLSCVGGEATSFIVKPHDSPEYRELLNECFVVVSENAPPLTVFVHRRMWKTHELVRSCIEVILAVDSSNLICCGYNMDKRVGPAVDVLTSPTWKLLLRRIGDDLFCHLLRYTSLFVPKTQTQHQHISGCRIGNLCFKPSRQIPEPNGSKKRGPDEGDEPIPRKRISTCTLGSGPSFVAGHGKNNAT